MADTSFIGTFRLSLRILFLSSFAIASHGRAEGVDLGVFKTEYPKAARALEHAYGHCHISATLTRTGDDGTPLWTEQSDMIRSNKLVRLTHTVLDSADSQTPVGTFSAEGGSADDYFDVYKFSESSPKFRWFGARKDFDRRVQIRLMPLYAPYSHIGEPISISEWISQKDIRVVSATSKQFEGQDAIEVIVEQFATEETLHFYFNSRLTDGSQVKLNSVVARHYLFFQPRTWALVGWICPSEGIDRILSFHKQISYEAGTSPPQIKALDYWTEASQGKSVKSNEFKYDISRVAFETIPDSEFHVEAIKELQGGRETVPELKQLPDLDPGTQKKNERRGLSAPEELGVIEHPVSPLLNQESHRREWILVGGALLLLVVGILLQVVTRRGKKSG